MHYLSGPSVTSVQWPLAVCRDTRERESVSVAHMCIQVAAACYVFPKHLLVEKSYFKAFFLVESLLGYKSLEDSPFKLTTGANYIHFQKSMDKESKNTKPDRCETCSP